MACELIIPDEIEAKFRRLRKRDRATFDRVMRKLEEVLKAPNEVGSPKKYHLAGCRGAHIGPFVLVWRPEGNPEPTAVRVVLFEHHDDVYE